MREELHHLLVRRAAQPRERDVGREFPRLGFESDALERRLDLLLKVQQRAVGAHARPQRARVLAAELTHAGELELEARRVDGEQRIIDVVTDILGDLADEAERQMELMVIHPARAGYATLQHAEALADAFRQFERDEEADHQRAPSGRLRRKPMTTRAKAAAPAVPAMTNAMSSRNPPAGPRRFSPRHRPRRNRGPPRSLPRRPGRDRA